MDIAIHHELAFSDRYRRLSRKSVGKPAVASLKLLKRHFDACEPNKVLVTDISFIRTYEDWPDLAMELDLFSRQAVGQSMKSKMASNLTIDALQLAVLGR